MNKSDIVKEYNSLYKHNETIIVRTVAIMIQMLGFSAAFLALASKGFNSELSIPLVVFGVVALLLIYMKLKKLNNNIKYFSRLNNRIKSEIIIMLSLEDDKKSCAAQYSKFLSDIKLEKFSEEASAVSLSVQEGNLNQGESY